MITEARTPLCTEAVLGMRSVERFSLPDMNKPNEKGIKHSKTGVTQIGGSQCLSLRWLEKLLCILLLIPRPLSALY